jgi:hypothetical protein
MLAYSFLAAMPERTHSGRLSRQTGDEPLLADWIASSPLREDERVVDRAGDACALT